MDHLIPIGIAAFLASGITFFSGFGLGTILLPVFALFLPIELAVLATAIVHLLNNLFKLVLVGRHASWHFVIRFGIPAIIAAVAGAWLLGQMTDLAPIHTYMLGDRIHQITPLKLVIGGLLFIFAWFDLLPRLRELSFPPRYIPIGGLLSGFFGGLSGHQGALRSAFLIKTGLSKEAFIATGVVIAVMIDLARLIVYSGTLIDADSSTVSTPVIVATFSAFAGAYLGNKLLRKITIKALQIIVGAMLLLFSVAMMVGLI